MTEKNRVVFFVVDELDGMGWDRLSGTGVSTALKIVQWPTPFLSSHSASRSGGVTTPKVTIQRLF